MKRRKPNTPGRPRRRRSRPTPTRRRSATRRPPSRAARTTRPTMATRQAAAAPPRCSSSLPPRSPLPSAQPQEPRRGGAPPRRHRTLAPGTGDALPCAHGPVDLYGAGRCHVTKMKNLDLSALRSHLAREPSETSIDLKDEDVRNFVSGWRDAALKGNPCYDDGVWLIVQKPTRIDFQYPGMVDDDGRELKLLAVHDAFWHFTHGLAQEECSRDDYEAALDVFLFAVKTAVAGSESDWVKIKTLARQLNTDTDRRVRGLAIVESLLTDIHTYISAASAFRSKADADPKHVADVLAVSEKATNIRLNLLIDQLWIAVDPKFKKLDDRKVRTWALEAKPNTNKGGAKNRGAAWVLGALAVSVGALGFTKEEGTAFLPAVTRAAKLLRKATADLRAPRARTRGVSKGRSDKGA